MINEENLNKLYQRVIEGAELTTKELNAMGFNSKDLSDLIAKESIIRVKRGLYALKNVDDLFFYGKKLIAEKEHDKAIACFQQCFALDPTHKGVSFRLFLNCLKEKDYSKAFAYFDVFYTSENQFYQTDYNFYLYMLSMITEIPEKYREYTKSLKYEDIKIDPEDKRYDNINLQNKVRLSAFNQRFYLAMSQLNDIISAKKKMSVQDHVTSILINQAIIVQMENIDTIKSLIKQEKYQEIVQFFDRQERYHCLSVSNRYAQRLTKTIIYILNTKTIPSIKLGKSTNVFDAIDNNDYELALTLEIKYNSIFNNKNEQSFIYLLLERILNLINKLKQDATLPLEESGKAKIEATIKEEPKPLTSTFNDAVKLLMQKDLDNAYITLRSYLVSINKSAYEFLILNLIKISLIKNDLAFTEPMKVLTLISKDNYTFDIASFIQEFYLNLSQEKFELARIYLDIITKGNTLSQDCIITDGLYQILELSEKDFAYKKEHTISLEEERVSDTKKDTETAKSLGVDEEPEEMLEVGEEPVKKFHEPSFMEKLVADKHKELLKNRGIILLSPMDEKEIATIIDLVKSYSDMKAFVIENVDYKDKQVMLKYHQHSKNFDVRGTINLCIQTYNDGKYDECINYSLQLLQFFPNPKSANFSKLGLCYLKKHNIGLAILYLTVANSLAKKEHLSYDFSALTARLKGMQVAKDSDKKPFFTIALEDFSESNSYYGISNFNNFNNFLIDTGYDVETGSRLWQLSGEETDLINLIYAREFYRQGDYERGDLFIAAYEMSKNKTEKTKRILAEIKKNKKFYQNRTTDNDIELSLTLVPKKL